MTDELLPPLAIQDYRSLRASILRDKEANCAKVTIVVNGATGEIVDGNHRLRVCEELGIEPQKVSVAYPTEHDVERAKVLLNLSRRHLTGNQRAELEGKLLLRGWTQQEVAEAMGVNQSTASRDATNMHLHNGCKPEVAKAQKRKRSPRRWEWPSRVSVRIQEISILIILVLPRSPRPRSRNERTN